MKPERVQFEDASPRQLLSHRREFDSIGRATEFVGQLGHLVQENQRLEVELRNHVVTVRVGSTASELTARETAFMEHLRGVG